MARTSLLLAALFLSLSGVARAAEPDSQTFHSDSLYFSDIEVDGEYVVLIRPESSEPYAEYLEIYTRDASGTWQVLQTVAPADAEQFHLLEMEGDVMIAGDDSRVFVFERDAASGLWRQAATLTPTNTESGRHIVSIATDGTHIAVAEAVAEESLVTPNGAIHYFEHDMATLAWRRLATYETRRAPVSLDVSGNRTAFVNAAGVVETLEYDGSELARTFLMAGVAEYGRGMQVRIEGDVMAVSSPNDTIPDLPPWEAGQVYVFEVEESGRAWDNVAIFSSLQPDHRTQFGHDMEMNDGIIAIAEGFEGGSTVSLVRKNETGEWVRFAVPDCGCMGYSARRAGYVSVSAVAMAAGSADTTGTLVIFDMAALINDDGDADDDDSGNDDPGDDGGDGSDGDDTGGGDSGSGADDGDTADGGGGGTSDAGDDGSDGGTAGSGGNSDTADGGGNPAGDETANMQENDGGGGAMMLLLGVLASVAGMRRRAKEAGVAQGSAA